MLTTWFNNPANFGLFADALSIIGAIFAGFAWLQAKRNNWQNQKEQKRLNAPIKILLQERGGSRRIELPGPLRRHELTRSELLGYIGMIPRKDSSRFFTINYTSSAAFFETMDHIQMSDDTNPFIIYCTPQEMEQFDVLSPKQTND